MRSLAVALLCTLSGCFLTGYETHDLPDPWNEGGAQKDGGDKDIDGGSDGGDFDIDAGDAKAGKPDAETDAGDASVPNLCKEDPSQCGPIAPCLDETCTCDELAPAMDAGVGDAGTRDDLDCTFSCDGLAGCRSFCRAGEHCQTVCLAANQCRTTCLNGATCEMQCGTGRCRGECESGSSCDFTCVGDSCNDVRCFGGASCILRCAPGVPCDFRICQNLKRDCGSGVVVCGTNCPPS